MIVAVCSVADPGNTGKRNNIQVHHHLCRHQAQHHRPTEKVLITELATHGTQKTASINALQALAQKGELMQMQLLTKEGADSVHVLSIPSMGLTP